MGDGYAGLCEGLGDRTGDLLGGVGLHGLRRGVVGGDPPQERMEGRAALGVVPGGHGQADQPRARGADVAGDDLGDLLAGPNLQIHGCAEEVPLGAEVVGHEGRIDAGGAGDPADRGASEPAGEERVAGRVQNRLTR